MIPAFSTNRYGDLLKEFYVGIKNNNLADVRMDEIQRVFNEMWTDFQKRNDSQSLNNPLLTNPIWLTSPFSMLIIRRFTDTAVPNATNTYIAFESVIQESSVFSLSPSDSSEINISSGNTTPSFEITGYVIWAANSTGYRAAYLEGFDQNGASVGSGPLHTFEGQNLVDNVLPISLPKNFGEVRNLKLFVHQTSGGDLTLKEVYIGLKLT